MKKLNEFGMFLISLCFLVAFLAGVDNAANAAAGDVTADIKSRTDSALLRDEIGALMVEITMPADYSTTQGGQSFTINDLQTATEWNTITAIYPGFYGNGFYICHPICADYESGTTCKVFLMKMSDGTELASGDVADSPCYLSVYGHE